MKKLTIENKFETYSVEFKNMDVSLEQFFDSLSGLLIACGWTTKSIDDYIVEWSEEIKDLRGMDEEDGFETYEKVKEERDRLMDIVVDMGKEEIRNRFIKGNSDAVDDMFEPTPLQQEFIGFNYLISKKDE